LYRPSTRKCLEREGTGVTKIEKIKIDITLMLTWGRFHQPFGANALVVILRRLGAVQFHQQNYAQLENTLNFYAVRRKPCASKIGVNLLAQKLRVKY
jgi:hypothetical protein